MNILVNGYNIDSVVFNVILNNVHIDLIDNKNRELNGFEIVPDFLFNEFCEISNLDKNKFFKQENFYIIDKLELFEKIINNSQYNIVNNYDLNKYDILVECENEKTIFNISSSSINEKNIFFDFLASYNGAIDLKNQLIYEKNIYGIIKTIIYNNKINLELFYSSYLTTPKLIKSEIKNYLKKQFSIHIQDNDINWLHSLSKNTSTVFNNNIFKLNNDVLFTPFSRYSKLTYIIIIALNFKKILNEFKNVGDIRKLINLSNMNLHSNVDNYHLAYFKNKNYNSEFWNLYDQVSFTEYLNCIKTKENFNFLTKNNPLYTSADFKNII